MPTYYVTWEIDLDAPDPRSAAEQALRIQRDSHSIATVFLVLEKGQPSSLVERIDLGPDPESTH